MHLPTQQSFSLGYFAGFGVASGSVAFLIQSRHPFADRPLIDFLMCLMIEPFTMLGSIFGVWLNLVFPSVILTVFLVIVLGISAWRTFVKAVQWRNQEKLGAEKATLPIEQYEPLLSVEQPQEVHDVLKEEAAFPWRYILVLLVLWLCLSVLVLLRGGDSAHVSFIGVRCGSWEWVALVLATFVFLILCMIGIAIWADGRHKYKVSDMFFVFQVIFD